MTGAACGCSALGLLLLGPAGAAAEPGGWLGVVLPGHSVDVAAELPGTVVAVHVGLGDAVAPGDTLAVLDAPAVRAELAGAEARLLAAEAEVVARAARVDELGRVLAQRTETSQLFTRDEIEARRSELRIAEADRSLAEARVAEAGARRAEVRRRLGGVIVRAPVYGEIARVDLVPGSQVAERQPAFRLVDTERVRVRFAVPEEELLRPAAGDTLQVRYEEAEAVIVVTARAPLLETEAGCLVFEAEPLAGADAGDGADAVPAGAVVRITRSAPAASPPDRVP